MQNPTIYTYLNQDFTAIPLFDGLSVDGISQESQADLHLADKILSIGNFSMENAVLQICANLLGICDSCY